MAAEGPERSEATGGAGTAFVALAVIVLLGAVFSWAVSNPSRRQYPERTPVRFWHMWTANWKEVVERICDRFNQSQLDYEVIPLSVPGRTADSKFLLAVAGGDPPDCMAQWNQVIPKWAETKLLVPLNSLMTDDEWQDFKETTYPVARKIGMYKGSLYGVTTGLNIWACYYRIDYLREAGLDPDAFPDTLEELVEWGRKLHRFDSGEHLVRIGFMPEWFMMYVPIFGGGFCDWRTGELTLKTPANLRALQYLTDCRHELGFDRVVRFASSLETQTGADWPFIGGAYAIKADGQWRVEQLKKYAPELKYGTAPIPPPAGGRKHAGWSNGNFMIIPAGAKEVRGAWAFIKFWSGLDRPERAAEFYTWGGWLPLNDRIANAPIYRQYVREHPQFQTFLDVLPSPHVQPTPPVPFQVYLADRIGRTDESAMRGTLTPTKALERLEREINEERAWRKEMGYDD